MSAAAQEPEAGRYLGGAKELARQRNDAVHQAGFDDVLAYLTLAGLVRRHRAVGQDEACDAPWRKVIQEVLYPGEVGVACRRRRRAPTVLSSLQLLATPIGDVEGGICEDVVGPQVRVAVIAEAVALLDAAH